METQIGEMITGDFQENTITFEIVGSDAVLQAGKYAIVPIDDYNKLIGNDGKKQHLYVDPVIYDCDECILYPCLSDSKHKINTCGDKVIKKLL